MIPENIVELITGTNNTTSKIYTEAVKTMNDGGKRSIGYVKNVLESIESVAIKEKSISESAGNITKFSGYQNITKAFSILKDSKSLGNLRTISESLASYRSEYEAGYNTKSRLVILEYEMSVYVLVTALTLHLGDFITKKPSTNKMVEELVDKTALALKDKKHKEYLKELSTTKKTKEINEKVEYTEGVVGDTIDLIKAGFGIISTGVKFSINTIKAIKSSLFGILPLMRSCMYFWYKRKANTILALEEQIHFIELNIEQLQNVKKMDATKKAEIIKRQEAVITGMTKKIEKLRAELMETSKEAEEALKEDEPKVQKVPDSDDDFILEKEDINLDAFKKDDVVIEGEQIE